MSACQYPACDCAVSFPDGYRPNDSECPRIYAEDFYAEAYFDECLVLKRELREQRAAIIEECARVADAFGDKYYFMSAADIAAAIRALKDKP